MPSERSPIELARVYDKTGREIKRGDVVKVYHYTAALRRKRHYMFKQSLGLRTLSSSGTVVMDFVHLNMTSDTYHEWADGRTLHDYEIVQSVDAAFEDRPRLAAAHRKAEEKIDE